MLAMQMQETEDVLAMQMQETEECKRLRILCVCLCVHDTGG